MVRERGVGVAALPTEGLCVLPAAAFERAPKRQAGKRRRVVSALLASFPAQEREFESNTEKEAPPNSGMIKQVKVMVGFWCFKKMFKGIKSRRDVTKSGT